MTLSGGGYAPGPQRSPSTLTGTRSCGILEISHECYSAGMAELIAGFDLGRQGLTDTDGVDRVRI
jgi:hypothetical protein